MTRAQVIAGIRRAATLFTALGWRVEWVPGWENRGRSGFNPRAGMNHDTADPAVVAWSSLLRVLINGHGAIAGNACCHFGVPRDAHALYVIAAGLAWHTGRATWRGKSGNSAFFGTEAQAAASQPGPTAQQNAMTLDWDACMCIAFNISPDDYCDHSEAALPRGRKQDRRGGLRRDAYRAALRRRVAELRDGRPTPAPAPPSTSGDWLAMASLADVQAALRRELYEMMTIPPAKKGDPNRIVFVNHLHRWFSVMDDPGMVVGVAAEKRIPFEPRRSTSGTALVREGYEQRAPSKSWDRYRSSK